MTSLEIPDVDPDVAAILDARSYCGWHVAPEVTEELILDGGGGDLLVLPTMRLVGLESITEDGVSLDPQLDVVQVRPRGKPIGLLAKTNGCQWTRRRSGVVINFTHGFEEPQDFWSAVASYRDRTVDGGLSGGGREAVGPFVFGATTAEYCQFSTAEKAILDRYRLEYSA